MNKPKIEVLCEANYWSIYNEILSEFKNDIKLKIIECLSDSLPFFNEYGDFELGHFGCNAINIDFNRSKVEADLNFNGLDDEPGPNIKVIWSSQTIKE